MARRVPWILLAVLALLVAVYRLPDRSPPPAVRPLAAPAPPPRTSGVTEVRLLDERGRPVAGVPVWSGDGVLTFTPDEGHSNSGELLGESDSEGHFVPTAFPVEINVAPWPSAPSSLTIPDDGRTHVLTVAEACPITLTWDDPGDPNVTEVTLSLIFSARITDRSATLTVPCGALDVGTRSRSTPRVEPVPRQVDTRAGDAHVTWREPDAVTICVTDESGGHPDATIGTAWREGDCWRHPGTGCAYIRAEGYLDTELCPDEGWLGWIWDTYDVTLEAGVEVSVQCEGGPCPERMGVLSCITDATPDRGPCGTDRCTCPDESDARVVASAGPYGGESAWVRDRVATFAHTGTATLTVRGAPEGAVLLRSERDGDIVVGRLPADGVRTGLVAGTYRVTSNVEGGTLERTGISLEDGESREVNFAVPNEEIEVLWEGAGGPAVFVVEGPEMRAIAWSSPVRVPAGATLWTCLDDGCCRFSDPDPRVTCRPDPAITPPVW